MDTQIPTIVKANQHHQLTIPSLIRKKLAVDKGSLFIAELKSDGVLFKPVTLNDNKIEYADPLTPEEEQAVTEGLEDLKHGRYTTISNRKELNKFFDKLDSK